MPQLKPISSVVKVAEMQGGQMAHGNKQGQNSLGGKVKTSSRMCK